MVKENIEFKFKNIDKTRNYCLKEIEQNKLIRKRHKKVYITLHFIEFFFILASLQLLDVFPFLHLLFCLVFPLELRVLQ